MDPHPCPNPPSPHRGTRAGTWRPVPWLVACRHTFVNPCVLLHGLLCVFCCQPDVPARLRLFPAYSFEVKVDKFIPVDTLNCSSFSVLRNDEAIKMPRLIHPFSC